MFKKFAAIAMGGGCLLAVALCLGLMPATALAAAPSGQELYVGGVQISSTGYWTTGSDGTVTSAGNTQPGDNYIHYDADTNTLTLHNATIQKELPPGLFISGSAIGVINQNGNAELTVQLEGSNTIDGVSQGIYVDSSGGGAALNIKGNGTLVLNSNFQTIQISSSNANAALSIENAKVTATSFYGFGVTVQSGSSEISTLTVDGGSLTATAQSSGVSGIRLRLGTSGTIGGTPTFTVSNNAIVRANGSAGGITSNSSTGVQYGTGGNSTGGIVFDGNTGTVYGNVTLDENLTISESETLTVPEGSALNTNGNLTNNGTIINKGELTGTPSGTGTTETAPTITARPEDQTVTEGETTTFAIEATGGNLSYQWQQSTDNGQSWTDIDGATGASYATEASTASMNGYQYRCVASNSAGSATSDAATLTVHVHAWGEPAWSWSEDGKTCTVTFTCENDETHKEAPEVEVTSAVKTPATCTEAGVTAYTATVEFGGKTYTDTKEITDIPATGHDYGEPAWSWSEDGKTATATFTCKNDGSHQATEDAAVTSTVKTPATCTEAGVTTHTATVEFDGKTYTDTKDVADIPAVGHKLTKTEAEAPTCTEPGSAEYWTCGVCGKAFSDAAGEHEITPEDAAIPATGHEFEGGLCSVCGTRDTSFSPALVSGDGAKWTKGSSKGLTFVSSAAFADLVEVRLDGRVLSASEYAVREGSTIVTLPAKLLEGLKAGDHELLIVSGSGTVRASLTVAEAAMVEEAAKAEKASADELPANGDSTSPALAIAAAAAVGAGLVILSRRRAAR